MGDNKVTNFDKCFVNLDLKTNIRGYKYDTVLFDFEKTYIKFLICLYFILVLIVTNIFSDKTTGHGHFKVLNITKPQRVILSNTPIIELNRY